MGEADRYQEYSKTKRKFTLGQPGNALFSLFAINIVTFFLILLANVFSMYTHQGQATPGGNAMEWFAIPANLTSLTEKPWTLITFMFSEGGGIAPFAVLLTMLSSMLWLYAFGYILQDLSGNRYIFPVYIYGSLLAAVFFILAANIIPALRQYNGSLFLYGAQSGTTAMAVAVTTLSPQYRVFKNIGAGIPVWIVMGLYVLLNFIYAFSFSSAGSFAVLGAALAGFLFIILLRKGKDAGSWMHNLYDWSSNLFTPGRQKKANGVREKVFYNAGNRNPYNKTSNITQQRIDEILDKISNKGYHFLTEEEKNILKRAGEADL